MFCWMKQEKKVSLHSWKNQHNIKNLLKKNIKQKFEKLKLSKKERKVIGDVLDCQSATDSEYSLLAYIAGIIDCLKFQEYIRELKSVQKDMPC